MTQGIKPESYIQSINQSYRPTANDALNVYKQIGFAYVNWKVFLQLMSIFQGIEDNTMVGKFFQALRNKNKIMLSYGDITAICSNSFKLEHKNASNLVQCIYDAMGVPLEGDISVSDIQKVNSS